MQMIEISKLIPHPRNNEFFDDIEGGKWEDFRKSIVRRGVVEAIVITQDLMIVSGHQRVRACKELGILEVPCRITHYPDVDKKIGNNKDDLILEDLISTNIIQRGIGNVNPMKMAKCIIQLEKIYGIRDGSAGKRSLEENNSCLKTQKDFAQELGIDDSQLRNYKKLLKLIPELQDLVESGELKATTAYKIYAKLSPEDQEELFNNIGKDKIAKLTQKETEKLIKEKNKLELEKDELENKLQQERNKPAKVIDNTDYSTIDTLKSQLSIKEKDMEILKRDKDLLERKVKLNEDDAKKFNDLKTQIDFLNREKDDIARQIESATELSGLSVKIDNFLKTELSPIRYSRTLERMDSEVAINNLEDIISSVESWCADMRKYLPYRNTNNNNIIDVEVI